MLCIIFRAFYPICDYAVYFYGSSIASQAYQHVNAKFWISCESKLQRASCEECICLLLHMKRVMRFFFTHVTYVGGSLGFRTEPQTQTTSLIGLPACQRDGDDSVARRLVCVCVCVWWPVPDQHQERLSAGYMRCIHWSVWLHLFEWLWNDLVLKVFRGKPYHRVTTDESASQRPVCWCWSAKYDFLSCVVLLTVLCAVCDRSEMIRPVHLHVIVIFICKPPTCVLQRDRKTRSGQRCACETNLSDSFCEGVSEWDKNPQTLTFALWTSWPDCLMIISSTVYVRFLLSPKNAPALINDIWYRSFG